ncbi:MAG: hypothetical protein KJ072_26210 [Verrucomicrobia bacterium]|nr:hypothetical protein [Verrucomicrobiota bacterium]
MFVVGVCSGVAAPYNNGSGSTTHFFGFYENAATLTRYAAAGANPAYYRGALNTGASLRRVGTTNAAYGGPLHYAWYLMTGNRTLCFLDIRKNTSPTAWEVMLHCKSGVDNHDVTYADFINCATLDTFNFQSHSEYGWRSSVSATPNEATNGYFDAVNISWDRSNPKVEISDLAIVRFA